MMSTISSECNDKVTFGLDRVQIRATPGQRGAPIMNLTEEEKERELLWAAGQLLLQDPMDCFNRLLSKSWLQERSNRIELGRGESDFTCPGAHLSQFTMQRMESHTEL